jgi:DNA repair exonuclease SbcCD ATPase subunit
MSITFNKIRWKNFLSTGDNFTEIDLTVAPKTLIVGENGAGKSTLLDALNYVLFNKPHRNINKPQLVNSINEKHMVVEIEFRIGRNNFKVVRGQKPGIFEIYQNDELINQAASSRDYQAHLEQSILRLNYKSFNQVVVLGSSSFIPFMQLPTGQRRDIIENLLDIDIFTKMNQILREQHSGLKERHRDISTNLHVIGEKIKVQQKYIHDIEQLNKGLIDEKRAEIARLSTEYDKYDAASQKVQKRVDLGLEEHARRLEKVNARFEEEQERLQKVTSSLKESKKHLRFFQQNDTCPVCTQEVDHTLSESEIEKHSHSIDEYQATSTEITAILDDLTTKSKQLYQVRDAIAKEEAKVRSYQEEMRMITRSINGLNQDIANLQEKGGDVEEASRDLVALEADKSSAEYDLQDINEQMNYNTLKFEMLKDTGIKTKIIRRYRPVINKLINDYLQVLDFFVQFTLDENFKEIIKSRHRDIFSYSSFSEGEKSRIDLALLFTWRQIAAMKNSMKTNLLLLDETFDSSLDTDGVDNLLKILDTLEENTNVFVISHKKDMLDSKFPRKLTYKKINNFSVCFED